MGATSWTVRSYRISYPEVREESELNGDFWLFPPLFLLNLAQWGSYTHGELQIVLAQQIVPHTIPESSVLEQSYRSKTIVKHMRTQLFIGVDRSGREERGDLRSLITSRYSQSSLYRPATASTCVLKACLRVSGSVMLVT